MLNRYTVEKPYRGFEYEYVDTIQIHQTIAQSPVATIFNKCALRTVRHAKLVRQIQAQHATVCNQTAQHGFPRATKRYFLRGVGTVSLASNSAMRLGKISEKRVIAMGISRFMFLLFVTTSAAAADEVPHQRPGEWQIVRLGNENVIPDFGSTVCLVDQSVLAKFDSIPDCIRKEVHTDGAITTADAQCRLHGEILSYHEKILKLDDDNFYTLLYAGYFPPGFRGRDMEQDDLISFMHLKRIGPCGHSKKPPKN